MQKSVLKTASGSRKQRQKSRSDRKEGTQLRTKPSIVPDASGVLAMLRNLIEEGGYTEGMMLPAERILAERFGVGRPAVREAIKALSILDVIESRRGDGTYLKSLQGLRAGWPAKVELRSSSFNLLDLLEVRKMIEPAAARLAAARAGHVDLLKIEQERRRIEESEDWSGMACHDLLLHTAIIEAAKNPVLTELNNALSRLQRMSRNITGASAPDCDAMLRNHARIVDAILRGEGEIAEKAMLEHLHQVGLDLISSRKR